MPRRLSSERFFNATSRLLALSRTFLFCEALGVDDEVGLKVRARWLDEDMNLFAISRPALGVADDPVHRVAGSDRAGADKLLAGCSAMSVTWPDAA
jgi:hypothetical protein